LDPRQVPSFPDLLADEAFFKFCFVRNPFTRLLSCYLDKIQRNRPQKAAILRQLGLPDHRLDAPVSFEQFVKAVVEQPAALMDVHWRAQYYQTLQAGIKYDFIGRFERFAEDMRIAGGRIAEDFGSYFGGEVYNGTDAGAAAEHYLTMDLKKDIRRKYEIDFEYFGYAGE
jgi:dermatan 4-sulfotransferase 1